MRNASLDAAVTSASASSFTALLQLPPTQVVKLLHHEDDDDTAHPTPPCTDSLQIDPNASNLIDNNHHNHSVVPDLLLEIEILNPVVEIERKLPEKRKKTKVKKKIKEEEEEEEEEEDSDEIEDGENEVMRGYRGRKKIKKEESQSQLPYVLVRARRGQATDSHSIAERARREKINARMKLLQELVPGCSKISGIALVLDEIINHVQGLQRQVEFLSMQLAAVNPRIEFNLDYFIDDENAFVEGSFLGMHSPYEWSDPQVNGLTGYKRAYDQQWQCDAYHQPQWLKEENHFESPIMQETTHLMNNSSPDTELWKKLFRFDLHRLLFFPLL